MSTTYNHAQIGIVDASGNVNVIYPATTGDDVSISRSSNAKLPSTVSSAQTLANALGSLAFLSTVINDSSTTSTTETWSANKLNSTVTTLNSNIAKNAKKGRCVLLYQIDATSGSNTISTESTVTLDTNTYSSYGLIVMTDNGNRKLILIPSDLLEASTAAYDDTYMSIASSTAAGSYTINGSLARSSSNKLRVWASVKGYALSKCYLYGIY